MVIFKRKNNKHKQVERTFQKNRFYSVPKTIKFRLGEAALISLKEARLELVNIGKIKRLLKRTITRRDKDYIFAREKI